MATQVQPTLIARQDSDSVFTCWASDAATIFQAFSTPSGTLAKKGKSWYSPGKSGRTMRKELQRVYAEIASPYGPFNRQFNQQFLQFGQGLTISIDTENLSVPVTVGPPNVTSGSPLIFAGNPQGIVCLIFGLTISFTVPTLDFVWFAVGYFDYSRFQ